MELTEQELRFIKLVRDCEMGISGIAFLVSESSSKTASQKYRDEDSKDKWTMYANKFNHFAKTEFE